MKCIVLIIMLVFLISGCNDGSIYLNATSTGECVIVCRVISKSFFCVQTNAVYGTTIMNDKLINNSCECILLDCVKEINTE